MITEKDLLEAIAECEGIRHPTASTCIKLASFYTILNQIQKPTQERIEPIQGYSFDSGIKYSDSEFSRVVQDKGIEKCFPILDELMSVLIAVNPKLYNHVLVKLSNIV